MADTIDDGEFWLPPRFLADDDENDDVLAFDDKAAFGSPFFSSSSDISSNSPVESESDEDDYLSGLTRQLAHSTLHNNKYTKVVSPQSTLSPVYGGKPANGQTRDLLFAAAGEVSRMMSSHVSVNQQNGAVMVGGPPPPSYQSGAAGNRDFGVHLSQQQLHALKFEQMRRMQLLRQKAAETWAAKANARRRLMGARPLGLEQSAWPSLQQAQQQGNKSGGDGMGAVFLGNRQSAGTGFFLPRAPAPAELRRKPACSRVLVPEKVAYALNFDLDKMGGQSQLNGGSVAVHLTGTGNFIARQRGPGAYQKRCDVRTQQQAVVNNREVQLPQEWTY